jgi:5-methyltetrahydrofolate--homocysteine methyltransferase
MRRGATLVALSALLTTTMAIMKDTVEALVRSGKRSRVKVIIGGAPVTDDFCRKIGADGYAPDASRAASLAKSLLA